MSDMRPAWIDELSLQLAEVAYEFMPDPPRPSQTTARLQVGFTKVIWDELARLTKDAE